MQKQGDGESIYSIINEYIQEKRFIEKTYENEDYFYCMDLDSKPIMEIAGELTAYRIRLLHSAYWLVNTQLEEPLYSKIGDMIIEKDQDIYEVIPIPETEECILDKENKRFRCKWDYNHKIKEFDINYEELINYESTG
jgi:hypothetical protein